MSVDPQLSFSSRTLMLKQLDRNAFQIKERSLEVVDQGNGNSTAHRRIPLKSICRLLPFMILVDMLATLLTAHG